MRDKYSCFYYMGYANISIGNNAPQEVNALIEISSGSEPIKYEFDKKSGLLIVDRVMSTSMQYPCNYGFIPNTLSKDGDPLDILVHTNYRLVERSVILVRPIGVLITEDESGGDEKNFISSGY